MCVYSSPSFRFLLLLFILLLFFCPTRTEDNDGGSHRGTPPTHRYYRRITLRHAIPLFNSPTSPSPITIPEILSKLEDLRSIINMGRLPHPETILSTTTPTNDPENVTALYDFVFAHHLKIRTFAISELFSKLELVITLNTLELMQAEADIPLFFTDSHTPRDLKERKESWDRSIREGIGGTRKLRNGCEDMRFTAPQVSFYTGNHDDPYGETPHSPAMTDEEIQQKEEETIGSSDEWISGPIEWQNETVPVLEMSHQRDNFYPYWIEGGCALENTRVWVYIESAFDLNTYFVRLEDIQEEDIRGTRGKTGPFLFLRAEMLLRYGRLATFDKSNSPTGSDVESASLLWLGEFFLAANSSDTCDWDPSIPDPGRDERDEYWDREDEELGVPWRHRWTVGPAGAFDRRFPRLTSGGTTGALREIDVHRHSLVPSSFCGPAGPVDIVDCHPDPTGNLSSRVDHAHFLPDPETIQTGTPTEHDPPFVEFAFCSTQELNIRSGFVFFGFVPVETVDDMEVPFNASLCYCDSNECSTRVWQDLSPDYAGRFVKAGDYGILQMKTNLVEESSAVIGHEHYLRAIDLEEESPDVIERFRVNSSGLRFPYLPHSHQTDSTYVEEAYNETFPPHFYVEALQLLSSNLSSVADCSVDREFFPKEEFLQKMVFFATRLPPLGWVPVEMDSGFYVAVGSPSTFGLRSGQPEHSHRVSVVSRDATGMINLRMDGTPAGAISCVQAEHHHPCEYETGPAANELFSADVMMIRRKVPSFYATVAEREYDAHAMYEEGPASLFDLIFGISLGSTLLVLVVFFVLCPIFTIVGCVIAKQKKKLTVLDSIQDLEMILAEQARDADNSIAHLKVEKSIYEVDFTEIEVQRKIGSGGSNSIVFLANYHGQEVAFKAFQTRDVCQDQRTYDDFEKVCIPPIPSHESIKEVTILSSLLHPHILNFFGATLHPPRVGILMEYCQFGDLEHFLSHHESENGEPFPLQGRIRFAWEISTAVSFLHSREIIHRDLKTENVLVGTGVVYFGLSRSVKTHAGAAKTVRVGTAAFMAPEITKSGFYDVHADTFSFGIMLYCLAANTCEPYEDQAASNFNIELKVANDSEFRPKIAPHEEIVKRPWLSNLIVAAWDESPMARPSVDHIAKVLRKRLDTWSEDHGIGDDSPMLQSRGKGGDGGGQTAGMSNSDLRRILEERDAEIERLKYEMSALREKTGDGDGEESSGSSSSDSDDEESA